MPFNFALPPPKKRKQMERKLNGKEERKRKVKDLVEIG